MVYRIIISHNQSAHIRQFGRISNTVVTLDAPTHQDIDACSDMGFVYVVPEYTGNRSNNRNTGLAYIFNTYNVSDTDLIEFFDGDRYPINGYNATNIDTLMADEHIDCLLYTCNNDARLTRIYVPLEGFSIVDTGTLCNPFYSCGFAMRVSAIHKIMTLNEGEFFNTLFKGWGCEDQYMGLLCSVLNLKVAITSMVTLAGSVGGDSYAHSGYRDSLQVYVDLIRKNNIPIRN